MQGAEAQSCQGCKATCYRGSRLTGPAAARLAGNLWVLVAGWGLVLTQGHPCSSSLPRADRDKERDKERDQVSFLFSLKSEACCSRVPER